MWRRLFTDDIQNWRLAAAVLAPTAVLAWLIARGARRTAAMAPPHLLRDSIATTSPLVRAPLRLIGMATFALVFTVLLFPAFEIAGLHPRAGLHLRTLSTWAFGPGLRLVLVAVAAAALIRIVSLAVTRFE